VPPQQLGIQQPPLGQHIRLLELQLGVQLFERSPRRIDLSDTGRFFLREAGSCMGGEQSFSAVQND
jgi:DNA-binding transcriptional LysR family regulator